MPRKQVTLLDRAKADLFTATTLMSICKTLIAIADNLTPHEEDNCELSPSNQFNKKHEGFAT